MSRLWLQRRNFCLNSLDRQTTFSRVAAADHMFDICRKYHEECSVSFDHKFCETNVEKSVSGSNGLEVEVCTKSKPVKGPDAPILA